MITNRKRRTFLTSLVVIMVACSTAGAISITDFTVIPPPSIILTFDAITSNNPNTAQTDAIGDNIGLGIAFDAVQDLLLVEFVNLAADGVIAEIYFDDDNGLLGNVGIYDESGAGVDYATNAEREVKPKDLPGGNAVGFVADRELSSQANNPAPANGVGSGERVTLSFSFLGNDLEQIVTSLAEGSLRTGMHVISIGEYSEGFVNMPFDPSDPPGPQVPIPEPATALLLGMGVVATVIRRRVTA
jgi:hypothetical protein